MYARKIAFILYVLKHNFKACVCMPTRQHTTNLLTSLQTLLLYANFVTITN